MGPDEKLRPLTLFPERKERREARLDIFLRRAMIWNSYVLLGLVVGTT